MRGRGALVAAGACAAALAAGCTAEVQGQPTQPAGPGALATFDMCTVLTPAELRDLGVDSPGEPFDVVGDLGCKFVGERIILTTTRDHSKPFSFYAQRAPSYDRYVENRVNDRRGSQVVTSQSGRECSQIVPAGRGTVNIGMIYRFDYIGTGDPCADGLRIAELIEPRLPEVGS